MPLLQPEQKAKIAVPPLAREFLTEFPSTGANTPMRCIGRTRPTLLSLQAATPGGIRISTSAASHQPAAL